MLGRPPIKGPHERKKTPPPPHGEKERRKALTW